jgi:hypothetical protein
MEKSARTSEQSLIVQPSSPNQTIGSRASISPPSEWIPSARSVDHDRFPTSMLAATLTHASVRVVCRRCGTRGTYMVMNSPAARTHESSAPLRTRPLGHRTQMMARGPGWRLAEGEAGTWMIKLIASDDPVVTWTHLLRTVRSISDRHATRATVIDLRGGERLAGVAAKAAGLLFAEFEDRGVRIATVVGPDLIHAARVHRLMGASVHGRCFLLEEEAIEWVVSSIPPEPPPVPPPLRMLHGRSLELQPPRV